ncbi:hypothetical protein SFRURICE_014843 [Spodoptera frugiperda]|nr:hypothetical protein SFRURICE_014843 [Spodoptera frugiperda]
MERCVLWMRVIDVRCVLWVCTINGFRTIDTSHTRASDLPRTATFDCLVVRVFASTTARQEVSRSIPGSSKVILGDFRFFEKFPSSSTESGIVPSIWQ